MLDPTASGPPAEKSTAGAAEPPARWQRGCVWCRGGKWNRPGGGYRPASATKSQASSILYRGLSFYRKSRLWALFFTLSGSLPLNPSAPTLGCGGQLNWQTWDGRWEDPPPPRPSSGRDPARGVDSGSPGSGPAGLLCPGCVFWELPCPRLESGDDSSHVLGLL